MPLRITGGLQACRKAGGALAQAACPSRRQRTWRPLLTVLTAARGTCRCRRCRAPLSRSRTRPVRLITCLRCGAKAIDAQLLRHACTAGCLQAWMQPRVATGLWEVSPCAAQAPRPRAGARAGAARPAVHLPPSDLLIARLWRLLNGERAGAAGEDPPIDMLRAAARLVGNHAAVTRFAARGCGRPGRRPVSAPLADPSAEPGEAHMPSVDAGARRSQGRTKC